MYNCNNKVLHILNYQIDIAVSFSNMLEINNQAFEELWDHTKDSVSSCIFKRVYDE